MSELSNAQRAALLRSRSGKLHGKVNKSTKKALVRHELVTADGHLTKLGRQVVAQLEWEQEHPIHYTPA